MVEVSGCHLISLSLPRGSLLALLGVAVRGFEQGNLTSLSTREALGGPLVRGRVKLQL